MFLTTPKRILAIDRWPNSGYQYNSSHAFSRWLIKNRTQLVLQVPAIYETMIRTLVLNNDKKKICYTINGCLNVLKKQYGNPFCVHDDLLLLEEYFV